jgi:ATP-dependent RNA circularization protein (DNA/RNA ligase family)
MRIWKDIGITEEDQEKLRTYAEQIGLAIYDKPYEQTRFSADSIKTIEDQPIAKEDDDITSLEAKLKKLRIKQEIKALEDMEKNEVLIPKKTKRKWPKELKSKK